VADWYRSTILEAAWGFPPERFRSQEFWDAFEQILPEHLDPLSSADDPLDQAQLRLLGLWKQKQRVSRRLLCYDTTNFYTYIASNNTRNALAQRGHNKQGRHNLRQVGLSYVLDGEHGLSLCHHVYRGDIGDSEEFSVSLARMLGMLDRTQIARDSVTLVFDKGAAALANTVELEQAGVGWISALPWNQAPRVSRTRGGTTAALQQRAARGAGGGRETSGAWQGIPLRAEVFGLLCRGAVAQPDHQSQQSAAVSAPLLHGIEQTASPLERRSDSQQDPPLVIGPVPGGIDPLGDPIPAGPVETAV
jgi:hypothetical protein